jgi:hypothetical protein
MKPILILSENLQVIEAVTQELTKLHAEFASNVVIVKKRNEAIIKLRNQKFQAVLLDSVDETNYDFLLEYMGPVLVMTHPLEREGIEYFIKLRVKKVLYYPSSPPQIASHFKKLISLC